jgi:hypothetical protein
MIDRVFYINLDRSTDRRSAIEKTIASIGLSHIAERVPGVVWDHEIPPWFRSRKGRNVKGHFGCAMAHLECYRRIKLGGYRWSLILEDDVVVPDLSAFHAAIGNLKSDFSLAYLMHGGNPSEVYQVSDTDWHGIRGQTGLYAYLVNGRDIDWFLYHADPMIERPRHRNCFGGVVDRVLPYELSVAGMTMLRTNTDLFKHIGTESEIRSNR